MSLSLMLTKTATIHHVTSTGSPDAYNHPTPQESTTTATIYIEPISSDEDTAGRSSAVANYRAFLEPTIVLDPTDTITVDGIDYEVVEVPGRHVNARTGQLHHLEVLLTETT